jgi:hypothetical protein
MVRRSAYRCAGLQRAILLPGAGPYVIAGYNRVIGSLVAGRLINSTTRQG